MREKKMKPPPRYPFVMNIAGRGGKNPGISPRPNEECFMLPCWITGWSIYSNRPNRSFAKENEAKN